MGTGKKYIITTIQHVEDALKNKYGSYETTSNPNGVIIHYKTASSIIFSCFAISDKVIRLYNLAYGYVAYGDSWVSGDAVTNQILFGGSSYQAAPDAREIVLSDNSMIMNWYKPGDVTPLNARLVVIGKISNGKYVAIGLYQSANYRSGSFCYLTEGNIELSIVGSLSPLLSPSGEVYKSKVYFANFANEGITNNDGSLAYLIDVESAYYTTTNPITLPGCYLTSGAMNTASRINALPNSLIVELGS